MEFDRYGLAILDFIRNDTRNLIVGARAGTGKTRLLEEALAQLPRTKTVTAIAFGRDIRAELARRLPEHVRVRTFNSIGHELVKTHVRGFKGLNKNLSWDRVRAAMRKVYGRQYNEDFTSSFVRAVSMAKNRLVTTTEEIDDIVLLCGLYGEQAREVILHVLKISAANPQEIDYDDQIWLPTRLDLPKTVRSDVVFVDEFQDTSYGQMCLAIDAARERVIGFGDPFQAIFAFRGAGSATMGDLIKELNAVELPLARTYRCPHAVVRHVLKVFPEAAPFEAAPENPEGVVFEQLGPGELVDAFGALPGDFVISRTNKGAVEAWCQITAAGRPAIVAGRDLSKQLEILLDQGYLPVPEDEDSPTAKNEGLLIVQLRRALNSLLEAFDNDRDEVRAQIRRMTADTLSTKDHVVIGTVHKLKGLERDRVFVLGHTFSDLDPEFQEMYYVACTRARQELRIIGQPGQRPTRHAKERR